MLQWPVLEMTMMLNLIHSRTKGLEYPTHEEYSHGASLCIPWIPKSPNSRCLCSGIQVWALMFGNSGSVFRFVFGYSHSVFIFRYSGLEFRFGYTGLGIQVS